MDKTNHEILIHKFLSGNLSPEEDLQFSDWLAQDPGNLETFNQFESVWETSAAYQQGFTPSNGGMDAIKKKIDQLEVPSTDVVKPAVKTIGYKLALAAAAIVGVGYFAFNSKEIKKRVNAQPVEIVEEKIIELPQETLDEKPAVNEMVYAYDSKPEITETTQKKFFDVATKEPQLFKVDPNKEIVVKCKEGTILTFEPNSFEDENGFMATDEIELRVTEYYEYSDMIAANLSTTADGQLLESGGMIYTEAFLNGEKLVLADEKEMEIRFKGKGHTDKELYDGEIDQAGRMNWTLDEAARHQNINVELIGGKYAVSTRVHMFFARNYKLSRREKIALKGVKWKHQISIDDKGEKMGSLNMYASTDLDADLKISCEDAFFTAMEDFKQEISDVKYPMIAAKFMFEATAGKAKMHTEYDAGNNYGFTYTTPYSKPKMGWSNLDALFSRKDVPRINIAVPLAAGDDSEYELIFGDCRSILKGKRTKNGYYIFENVPKNQNIVLMAKRAGASGTEMAYCKTVSTRKMNTKVEGFKSFNDTAIREMLADLGFATSETNTLN